MAAVDTNVLVRLLAQDDPVQTRQAEAYLDVNSPLWISLPVLVETYYVLSRLYGWEKAALLAMLGSLSNSRQFIFQDQAAVVSASQVWSKAKAGFVDCLNVELAKRHGKAPLATFDRDVLKLDGSQGL
jgi:predicted nucleic-acid-binding protein